MNDLPAWCAIATFVASLVFFSSRSRHSLSNDVFLRCALLAGMAYGLAARNYSSELENFRILKGERRSDSRSAARVRR